MHMRSAILLLAYLAASVLGAMPREALRDADNINDVLAEPPEVQIDRRTVRSDIPE